MYQLQFLSKILCSPILRTLHPLQLKRRKSQLHTNNGITYTLTTDTKANNESYQMLCNAMSALTSFVGHQVSELVAFSVTLDTQQLTSETIFPANHLTGAKHGFHNQLLGWSSKVNLSATKLHTKA